MKLTFDRAESGVRIYDCLLSRSIAFSAPCGGRGSCGKCLVRVLSGSALDRSGAPLAPDRDGCVRACRAYVGEGLEIELPETVTYALSGIPDTVLEGEGRGAGQAIALDVGTTTLAAALVDLGSRKLLNTAACANPQSAYGADVMSRISACANDANALSAMQSAVASALSGLIRSLTDRTDLTAAVTGNTVMLHLFRGVSPVGMGAYPFEPLFTDAYVTSGDEFGMPVGKLTLLPSASAFIGSDIVCGVYASGMLSCESASLLTDVGTNGESVLCTGSLQGNRLYAVSAAAGPALEGANISCGCPAVNGALSHFNADLSFTTVGDLPPVGVCGSGLVDLVAVLLDRGVIRPDGSVEGDRFFIKGKHISGDGRVIREECDTGLSLTVEDVHAILLTKSAVNASLKLLLEKNGLVFDDLERFYISGGLGNNINPANAVRVGLFPEFENPSVIALGNSALAGAVRCLLDDAPDALRAIASGFKVIPLDGDPSFERSFIGGLRFPIN